MARPQKKRGYRRIIVSGLAFQWSFEPWRKPHLEVVLDEDTSSRACRLAIQNARRDGEAAPRHTLPSYVQEAIEKVLARSDPGHDLRKRFYETARGIGVMSGSDYVKFYGKDRINEENHPVFVASIIQLALDNGWDPTKHGTTSIIRYSREDRSWEWRNAD